MNGHDVIIIGGGLGGLFTGALLSKEGRRVTVIEKNRVVGGGLQTFRRGSAVFETGMHILGGLRPGGAVYRICDYLGIAHRLKLRDVDHDCMDEIYYHADGHTYRIPEGREAFTDYLVGQFPHEEQGIHAYIDALYRLVDEVDFFFLRSGSDNLFQHSEQFLWSASSFISHYVSDVRLRDLLAYMNPMYGGVEGHTPAYAHALINVLYLSGPSRFVDGSQQMADLLCEVIEQGGGRIVTGEQVTAVHTNSERQAVSIETSAGRFYSADDYVSAIHPSRLVGMVDAGNFPKSYRERIASIPNTYSAFTLYIQFRPEAFPYINHTCYYQHDYGQVWHHYEYDETTWPRGFMYMTPAESRCQDYAGKMIVNCLMPFSVVERWADTTVGHRGSDYEAWKAAQAEKVIRRLEHLYPHIRQQIAQVWTSSPLTIRDYYNQPEGALYGVRKDCQNIMLSQIPLATKVRNLFLTGQCINLHGICGVPLTAVNTAEAIVGRGKIIEKIKQAEARQTVPIEKDL